MSGGWQVTADELKQKLERFKCGEVTAEEIVSDMRAAPFEDMGFAKVDYHREIRQGMAEVVYGQGKTADEVLEICKKLFRKGGRPVLVTRLSAEKAQKLNFFGEDFHYDSVASMAIVGQTPKPNSSGKILVLTAGTSDAKVAKEAVLTARALGNDVDFLADVGVAGIERLLSHVREIQEARVIIARAGMEGALATVVSGLTDAPVIAVPTSVGYGAAFEGLAALLSMLNSCAGGVSVVNIDNGFGAAVIASRIIAQSRMVDKNETT